MKQLFLILLAVLVAAAFYTYGSLSAQQTDRPLISWNSDTNPQRIDQMDLFEKWLVKHGHTAPDGGPAVRMTIHVRTGEQPSTVIQAVSGVASDLLDQTKIEDFGPMGVLRSLEEFKKPDSQWTVDKTYPSAAALLMYDGQQMGYACNGVVNGMVFNVNELRRVGLSPDEIPAEWTPDEFEAFARRYVERANAGKPRREHFIGHTVEGGNGEMILHSMARSRGVDLFNETGTAAQCDDPRYVEGVKRLYKWTFEDRLYPNASDVASMSGDGGFGGVEFSQFIVGKFASMNIGRWIVVRLRETEDPIALHSTQLPMYEFKNMQMGMRISAMYAGARHPEYVKLFFDYLADREYNEYIIRHGDGLPPNPVFAVDNPAYATPPGHANEGNIHANELQWARTIALMGPYSPFFKGMGLSLLPNGITRVFHRRQTAEESMAEAKARYTRSINDTLEANPGLRARYQAALRDQARIDQCKERGEKIPASLVTNAYYLAYYRHTGQLEEDGPAAAPPTPPTEDQP